MSKISIFVSTIVGGFIIFQTICVIILMNARHWDTSKMDSGERMFCFCYLLSMTMAMIMTFVVGTLAWLTGGA